MVSTFSLSGPASDVFPSQSRRFAVAMQSTANKVEFFDGGVWTEGAGTAATGFRQAAKKLDFAVDLPGHGVPFTNKSLITAYQAYLTDLVNQVTKLKNEGVSPDDAAKRVDLTAHAKDFPQITAAGADIRGVRRMYAWLDEQRAAK